MPIPFSETRMLPTFWEASLVSLGKGLHTLSAFQFSLLLLLSKQWMPKAGQWTLYPADQLRRNK